MSRIRALLGVAGMRLRYDRRRTALAVLGVAMAVLASVLLVSVGLGVVETGQQKFDQSSRDLWVTGGPIELRPGSAGGFENTLTDAHTVAADIERRDDVATAVPMSFQTVYAGRNTSDYRSVVGVGAPASGPSVRITEGRPFQNNDIHYANGTYNGPMTHEVVIDRRTARLLNVTVNDTIYIGSTLATASENEFRIAGISPTYSRFVGAPTVVLHLSELQEVTGSTASDRATFVSVRLQDGANVSAVETDLEASYPSYSVRTNREQLQSILRGKVTIVASGVSLVALAVVAGILLTMNLQLSYIYQRRETYAALQALGTSTSSLILILLTQALVVGFLGGLVGVALAFPSAWLLNRVAAMLTGFEGVVSLTEPILLGGLCAALIVSCLSSVAGVLYLIRLQPLRVLNS